MKKYQLLHWVSEIEKIRDSKRNGEETDEICKKLISEMLAAADPASSEFSELVPLIAMLLDILLKIIGS